MKVIVPPIKSQGIKTKLVPWILALAPRTGGRWVEPFLGTGVVAFNAGFERALLSDANPHIIGFYKAIQDRAVTSARVRAYLQEEGAKLRAAGNDGYDRYIQVRNRFNRDRDPLDFLFLSRAGFNGLMRFNRKGEWNVPFCKKPGRFGKAYVTKIVNQVRNVSRAIRPEWAFSRTPFEETIARAGRNDVVYCDPPYWGRHVDYYNGWSADDERRLFEALSRTPARFVLSTWMRNAHRENEMVARYWKNFNIVTRDHFYHSGAKLENRRAVVEALAFNFDSDIEEHNHGAWPPAEQYRLRWAPAARRG